MNDLDLRNTFVKIRANLDALHYGFQPPPPLPLRERRFGYTTDRFWKKFDLYDLSWHCHFSCGLSSVEDFALGRKLKWDEGAWIFQIHHLPCLTAKVAARCADPDSVLTQWTRTAPQYFALFFAQTLQTRLDDVVDFSMSKSMRLQSSANGAFWRPPRVHGLKTFTAVMYEFLEKSPNFCFSLIRQSLPAHVSGGSFLEFWPAF